jgi:hypothetical protein
MVLNRALAKDPTKRYPTCAEFVTALDSALKTKKGWKPIPRGSSQNLPTEVVGTPIGVTTTQRNVRTVAPRRRLVWQILAASLVALGVVALLFVAAERWMSQGEPERQAAVTRPASAPAAAPKPAPMPPARPAPAIAKPEAPPAAPPAPTESQPAAEPPKSAATNPVAGQAAAPAPKPPAVASTAEQPLQIVTSPPGADAVLDNDSTKICKSPCSFHVSPGRHTLTISKQGYRRELRIVEVQRPQELFVSLTKATGIVVVSTETPGADILIDGKPIPEKTPARLTLPAGKYTVTVLRNGRRADQEIEVKDGSLLNFALQLNP